MDGDLSDCDIQLEVGHGDYGVLVDDASWDDSWLCYFFSDELDFN